MANLWIEIRYSASVLRRNAAFAATAIAALSLGIATNTAIFSVVNKVLLEPLPYPDPERLVQLMSKSPLGNQAVVSISKYGVWRGPYVFQHMAAYDFAAPDVNLTEGEVPQPVETAMQADLIDLGASRVA